jgi:hypothetical protein
MKTVICSISMKMPHKVPVEKCQGSLSDARHLYGEYAYWHGNNSSGWHALPVPDVEYVTCLEHSLSKFVVEEDEAKRFGLTYKV